MKEQTRAIPGAATETFDIAFATADAPPKPGEIVSKPSLKTRRADWELRDRQQRLRSGFAVGAIIWPAFAVLDLYVVLTLAPGTLAWFWGLRLSGWLVICCGYAFARWRDDLNNLQLSLLDLGVYTSSAVHIALMGVEYGGIKTPYAAGIVLVALARTAFMVGSWRASAVYYLAIWLAFPVTFFVIAQLDPRIAAQWSIDADRADFFVHNFILFGTFGMGTLAEDASWRLRSRAYEAQQLARYHLKRQIGHGATGAVWEAFHPGLRTEVALKVLHPTRALSARAVLRFEREVEAITHLCHPHTVRILDHGHTVDGIWFYAMELLRGASFDHVLREQGRLAPSRAVQLLVQATSALAEAHEMGIVHRDIKPANLFLAHTRDGSDFVKVLDFGVAKLGHDQVDLTLTRDGIAPGTPAYLAPEAWQGAPAHPAVDVFAFGAVLHELLFGAPPFEGLPTFHATAPYKLPDRTTDPSLPYLSPALQRVLVRCLAFAPSERFQHCGHLHAALLACPEATHRPAARPVERNAVVPTLRSTSQPHAMPT